MTEQCCGNCKYHVHEEDMVNIPCSKIVVIAGKGKRSEGLDYKICSI